MAHARWQDFATPQPLKDPIDRELLEQALLQPADTTPVMKAVQAETLVAWIHITNACNLDCPYCYVRKSSARMSLETGSAALRQIFATAQKQGFRSVKLKYAGGEATLHFKLIRQLHEIASNLAQKSNIQLKEVVLSNGFRIREEDAIWLANARVKLMISLDGVGAMHDQQRPLKGGGTTFTQIEKTIDDILLPSGVIPDITLTVTHLNAAGIADAMKWILARALPFSLNFYRRNPLSIGRKELQLEEQAIIAGMEAAYQVIAENLPAQPFLNGLLDRVQAEAHSHTCGVQHNYLVIRHDGALAQCQMHLDNPLPVAENARPLELIALGPIQNISVDEKEGCRDCVFRYRCSGGCPLETYQATGRWDIRSPHCHIYQTLLPQALKLEGLRLLKTNGLLPHA
ncbi:MAG: radical SAM protein [Anaerolineales bacterium]|nr:radical SAM protein [Anaerolineales bacterium]